MKYQSFLVCISERVPDCTDPLILRQAIVDMTQYLAQTGYQSLETELSSLLYDFLGASVDQVSIPFSRERVVFDQFWSELQRGTLMPPAFSTCLKRGDILLFVDAEPMDLTRRLMGGDTGKLHLEFEIFAPDASSADSAKSSVIDLAMKCFGLTGTVEEVVGSMSPDPRVLEWFGEHLVSSEPLSRTLFQKLMDKRDRDVLRELKKRGSVLERDLHEISPGGSSIERVKRTLDYFSGAEHRLVQRRYAIVCRKNDEIIFLLKDKDDLESAQHLECPRCSLSIGQEIVMSYYGSTDALKMLLDGSRWMPLLVRRSLEKAGVSVDQIYSEAKYGQDEVDIVAYYRDRVWVGELKDRPFTLNDAYKLSAKTARLESAYSRYRKELLSTDNAALGVGSIPPPNLAFVPVVVSTADIAPDAADLLRETRSTSRFLEQCETELDRFCSKLVDETDEGYLHSRLLRLIDRAKADSVSRLAAAQVERAFQVWKGIEEVDASSQRISGPGEPDDEG